MWKSFVSLWWRANTTNESNKVHRVKLKRRSLHKCQRMTLCPFLSPAFVIIWDRLMLNWLVFPLWHFCCCCCCIPFLSSSDWLFQSAVGVSSASHSVLWMTPPLCMHLIIPRSVYLVCVCLCTRVWAKSVDTLITSSLSSETAAGATVVMSPFDCCCSSDPEIVIIYALTVDAHLCVLFILLSLPSRPGVADVTD